MLELQEENKVLKEKLVSLAKNDFNLNLSETVLFKEVYESIDSIKKQISAGIEISKRVKIYKDSNLYSSV